MRRGTLLHIPASPLPYTLVDSIEFNVSEKTVHGDVLFCIQSLTNVNMANDQLIGYASYGSCWWGRYLRLFDCCCVSVCSWPW